ncbi:MAG: zinc ribbon domain-containing protein [Coriobacteriia bacterium]|nr:zinc ribbon domain-containing protein [Coriobacteriia bacterium]
MGLVNCLECGQPVSDLVETCPHCGSPEPTRDAQLKRIRAQSALMMQERDREIEEMQSAIRGNAEYMSMTEPELTKALVEMSLQADPPRFTWAAFKELATLLQERFPDNETAAEAKAHGMADFGARRRLDGDEVAYLTQKSLDRLYGVSMQPFYIARDLHGGPGGNSSNVSKLEYLDLKEFSLRDWGDGGLIPSATDFWLGITSDSDAIYCREGKASEVLRFFEDYDKLVADDQRAIPVDRQAIQSLNEALFSQGGHAQIRATARSGRGTTSPVTVAARPSS